MIIKKIWIPLLFVLFISCTNKKKTQLLDNSWRQYELVVNGKHISFILPDYYSTDASDIYPPEFAGNDDIEELYAFYSTKNSKDVFVITLQPMDSDYTIDSTVKNYFYKFIGAGMVPFFERGVDRNNYIYYFVMTSKIGQYNENYIYSWFSYITDIENKGYSCVLETHEPVSNTFSYEEKRKIIESVRIEDIK